MLARTKRESPAMLTTMRVMTGSTRWPPRSARTLSGWAPSNAHQSDVPKGGIVRVSHMPPTGNSLRGSWVKAKISSNPRMNVGKA